MAIAEHYIAVGSYDNWKSAFSKGSIWGLPENKRRTWERLEPGDVVFFYVESSINAVVGHGTVVRRLPYSDEPFFAEDWGGPSIWPWRFEFSIAWPAGDVLHGRRISVTGLEITLRKGFHRLPWRKAQELLRRSSQHP